MWLGEVTVLGEASQQTSTDPVLMRSIKAIGGMTRWWHDGDPARSIQEFTGVTSERSEQHKEISDSRFQRDHEDAK